MQLALFAEPTDLSDDLLFAMRRKVAIHTADLSLDERSFIEAGISEGRFDVCFATSTLAAGVNFPFRTVVFPNLTYRYGDRKGTQILRSDYRNMSGRAGRLGIHDKGYAVLLAKNVLEAKHANRIIRPQNDRVRSQLAKMAPRRSVLALTASRQAISKRELLQFLESTFYASRLGSHNRRKLQAVLHDAAAALDWLVREQLASERRGKYQATPLGSAIARTGLLPETALEFAHCLRQRPERLGSSLERHPAGLIHWACCSPEFAGPDATRFLAWVNPRDAASSAGFLADLQKSNVLLRVLDPQDATVCGNVHALVQYAEGIAEREITRSTKISSGYVHGAAKEVSWVLHGFQAICSVPSLECPQRISNQIASLAAQVRWGVPLAALDLLQGARRAKVLGFGRQSAMALVRHGATGRDAIRAAAPGRLAKWIGSTRAEALLAALSQIFRAPSHPLEPTHRKLGRKLGIEDLLARLAKASSDDYPIVLALLLEKEHEWVVTATGAPWILLRRGDRCARVWAVASPEGDAIGKEQLQAILAQNHEAADESALVVVARAGFDRAAKAVGRSQPDVALMEHVALVEAMLRRLAGAASCDEVFDWLAEPGDSELERIPGEWSYALARTLEPA